MRYMSEDLANELKQAIISGTEEPYQTELENKIDNLLKKRKFEVSLKIEGVEDKHLAEVEFDAIFIPLNFHRTSSNWQDDMLIIRFEEFSPETVHCGKT